MDKTAAKLWLHSMTLGLPDGQQKRVICPFCHGGSSKETSFVITNDGGQLKGSCWRGTCDEWVVSGFKQFSADKKKTKKQFIPREFWKATMLPPPKLLRWLWEDYALDKETLRREGLRYCLGNGRMVWPVFDIKGHTFGFNTKRTSACTDVYPKWMTFFDRETTRLHYPQGFKRNYRYDQMFVTEDIMSAVRISNFAPVVSLQGTTMTWEQVKELVGQTDKLVLALDPDKGGRDAVYKIKKQYSSMFKEGIESRALICDPKSYGDDVMLRYELGLDKQ